MGNGLVNETPSLIVEHNGFRSLLFWRPTSQKLRQRDHIKHWRGSFFGYDGLSDYGFPGVIFSMELLYVSSSEHRPNGQNQPKAVDTLEAECSGSIIFFLTAIFGRKQESVLPINTRPHFAMPRKAIDSRIPALIRNGVQEKKRSFFVVVGDHAKDVIVHLHYIMSSVDVKQNKSVLWAYKKDLLNFSSCLFIHI